nr:tRNA(Ile)-lysidine synthetase [Clostridium sp.]
DEKIPAGERDRIPLIADGSHILWIVGGRISAGVRITPGTRRILKLTYKKGAEDGRENSGR